MIRNLIFDFGKVLVDYEFDILDTLFDDAEECARFKSVVCAPEFVAKCDLEAIPYRRIIDELKQQYPEWERELDFFRDHQIDLITGEVPGMRELIGRWKAAGYHVYGLINWSSKVYELMEKYDICSLLEDRIVSSEEGCIKPDHAIYERLLEKFGLVAEECVFTDDREDNVQGAREVGMHAIVFKNAEQLEQELRKLHHLTGTAMTQVKTYKDVKI